MRIAAAISALMCIKDVDYDKAKLIRAIWRTTDPVKLAELVPKDRKGVILSFAFMPRTLRRTQRAVIDKVLGTCGVEYLGIHKASREHVYYCNVGDPYALTAIFIGDRLDVGCWGFLVECGQVIDAKEV